MLEPQEYIRKYGIEQAREFYKRIENKPMYSFNADMPRKYKDMINSHELVEKMGGLDGAKDALKNAIRIENFVKKDTFIIGFVKDSERIAYHIRKVESCQ